MRKIWAGNYLANLPIEKATADFGKRCPSHFKLLDIGCGEMPYKKYFSCEYIGSDYSDEHKPDIVAPAWDIPREDGSFDAIILQQALEHIAKTDDTAREMWRLLKPGGYAFVTVPQTMKNHSGLRNSSEAPVQNFSNAEEPYWRFDYYRFTKYGLLYVFRDFEVVKIRETTGYVGTIMQLINYFFISLRRGHIFAPIYIVNNVIGVVCDYFGNATRTSRSELLRRFYHVLYGSLTSNYVVILRKPNR